MVVRIAVGVVDVVDAAAASEPRPWSEMVPVSRRHRGRRMLVSMFRCFDHTNDARPGPSDTKETKQHQAARAFLFPASAKLGLQ